MVVMGDQTTVIVADDSDLFRSSIVRAVRSHPRLQLVGSARDGAMALELIQGKCPDVAMVDVRMPGLDGEQLLARLSLANSETRVLLLSAHIDAAMISRALGAGAAGCLGKDDTEEEILSAILRAAAGKTVVSTTLQPVLALYVRAQAIATDVRLSRREHEVLELSSRGKSAEQVAQELFVSRETVNTLLQRAGRKLGTRGKTQAVAEAIRRGLL
jgi:two-component system nitrate/nitrite response regulator NarL